MPRIWQDYAACRGVDTEKFFEPELDPVLRETCAKCPVREECLAYALADPTIVGWWAGTNSRQRAKMRARKVA